MKKRIQTVYSTTSANYEAFNKKYKELDDIISKYEKEHSFFGYVKQFFRLAGKVYNIARQLINLANSIVSLGTAVASFV